MHPTDKDALWAALRMQVSKVVPPVVHLYQVTIREVGMWVVSLRWVFPPAGHKPKLLCQKKKQIAEVMNLVAMVFPIEWWL